MFDYRRFHDVFPAEIQPPYNRNLQNDIEKYRRSYDGVLFLDRVLKALGIANGAPLRCLSLKINLSDSLSSSKVVSAQI